MTSKRIELTAEERGDRITTAFTFEVHDGRVKIIEHWSTKDETWGAGVSVTMPARVWAEGMRFVEAALKGTGDE